MTFFVIGPLALSGCKRTDERIYGCELGQAINYCVSINGQTGIPDSLIIVRTHSGGYRDTVPNSYPAPIKNCFSETSGKTTLQVYRDTTLLKQIDGILVGRNGCHGADTLIDIRL
ncbi:MAG: hypothetical protein JWP91_1195 [Fibrobacteres bacterium]|nr:hypothetical protein [Fibrobacterota bacterium]